MDMQNTSYSNQQSGNQGNGLVRFLLGLFTGVAVATPVTALVVKKICDRDKADAVAKASEEAENRGMQAMVDVCREEVAKQAASANRAISEPSRGISEGVSGNGGEAVKKTDISEGGKPYDEAYLASLQSPSDDDGTDYDLENYNLTIDDEEATQDASEFSEDHVKYLDMIERYKNANGDIPPMTISREQFMNEHFYEKAYVNWYEDDDIFEEDDAKIEDPAYSFGFASGRDMFSPERVAVRDEPDICYIRNLKLSTDFEVTRTHGSYERMVLDGEAYYNGEANSQY